MAKLRNIPKDTTVFHFHNENPKGQRAGDCVVRAIARATGSTWEETYDALAEEGRKQRRMPNDKKTYSAYLKRLGWVKRKQPRHWDGNRKYTGREFAEEHPTDNIIMHIGSHHITCIVDGQINDIWDCSDNCVGNYWVKL